jgi:hypothetical protein
MQQINALFNPHIADADMGEESMQHEEPVYSAYPQRIDAVLESMVSDFPVILPMTLNLHELDLSGFRITSTHALTIANSMKTNV